MAVTWDEVQEGAELPQMVKHTTTQQLVQWAGGSGDFYQIHYDLLFAKATGLEGLIVHGALKNAFLGQLVHDWVGRNGKIKQYGCSYRGMDPVDADIICKGVVKKKYEKDGEKLVEVEVWTENPAGAKTSPGTATVVFK